MTPIESDQIGVGGSVWEDGSVWVAGSVSLLFVLDVGEASLV